MPLRRGEVDDGLDRRVQELGGEDGRPRQRERDAEVAAHRHEAERGAMRHADDALLTERRPLSIRRGERPLKLGSRNFGRGVLNRSRQARDEPRRFLPLTRRKRQAITRSSTTERKKSAPHRSRERFRSTNG